MRVKIRFSFSYWSDEHVGAMEKIAPLLHEKSARLLQYSTSETPSHMNGRVRYRTHHSLDVYADDERYRLLKQQLDSMGLTHLELKEAVYDNSELDAAEFLQMVPAGYWGYPKPEDGYLNESYDTSSMCPHCGQGLTQVKPLLVGRPGRFGKRDIAALNWEFEWLVTSRLKGLILDAGLTGAEFWPVLYFRDRSPIKEVQELKITNVLAPMSPSTEFDVVEEEPLKKCGHTPRIFIEHQIRYKREDLERFQDFNLTNEYLGGGWFKLKRWSVVSSSVYKLFRQNKIGRVKFHPVITEN